jgi:hypothetical protein
MININKVKSESLVMKKIFIISTLMLLSAISVLGQTCEWAERIGGSDWETINSIAKDNNGSIYVAGNFESNTLILNNDKSLINNGGNDGFIAKYNSNGTCLWIESIAGTLDDNIGSIKVDNNGNIYVVGYFYSGTINFNNNKFLTNKSTKDNSGVMRCDAFIAKYNNNGICQWVEAISGSYLDFIYSITSDGNNNIYVVGNYRSDTLYFNNGKTLLNSSHYDGFIAKYNNDGICLWVENITGENDIVPKSIAVDSEGDVYLIGDVKFGNINFNNSKYLTNLDGTYFFLVKYNKDGICQWAEKIEGNNEVFASSITIFKNSSIYVSGYHKSDALNFNNDKKLTQIGKFDCFLAKYNGNGICQWAERIAGNETENINEIVTDLVENVYVVGSSNSYVLDFNNGISLNITDIYDGYFAKYNSNGICQWAEKITGNIGQYVSSINVDVNSNVFVTGGYRSSKLSLNNGISLTNSGVYNTYDGFIAKYSQNNTSIPIEPIQNNISVYPNPSGDYIEIQPSEGLEPLEGLDLQIFNIFGEIVLSVEQTSPSVHRIDVTKFSSGVYFIKIGNRIEKFVKT